jgi:phosphosulfolactate phosphohydrolase-like enzyme
MRLNRVDIALLPAEAAELRADCYVVVDALRATTTIAAFLSRGAASVTVVDSEDSARRTARERGAVLAGEVGGLPPEGFDTGNSPVEAMELGLDGREVVMFTTNGTLALCGASALGPTFAGALTNARTVAERCGSFEHVAFVCAGNGGGTVFSLEDFAVSGAIARELCGRGRESSRRGVSRKEEDGQGAKPSPSFPLPSQGRGKPKPRRNGDRLFPEMETGDSVQLALHALGEGSGADGVEWMVRSGKHAESLRAIGLDADIDFACRADIMDVAPQVRDFGPGWAQLEASG